MNHTRNSILGFMASGVALGVAAACLQTDLLAVGAGLAAFGVSMFGNSLRETILSCHEKHDEN